MFLCFLFCFIWLRFFWGAFFLFCCWIVFGVVLVLNGFFVFFEGSRATSLGPKPSSFFSLLSFLSSNRRSLFVPLKKGISVYFSVSPFVSL